MGLFILNNILGGQGTQLTAEHVAAVRKRGYAYNVESMYNPVHRHRTHYNLLRD
ncbi:MAG: hypothetical protein MZV63_56930 [Marinilabiliales bacterium]|nr:hypothetical protein [Marinilabiliales bacterium]